MLMLRVKAFAWRCVAREIETLYFLANKIVVIGVSVGLSLATQRNAQP